MTSLKNLFKLNKILKLNTENMENKENGKDKPSDDVKIPLNPKDLESNSPNINSDKKVLNNKPNNQPGAGNNLPPKMQTKKQSPTSKIIMLILTLAILGLLIWVLFFSSPTFAMSHDSLVEGFNSGNYNIADGSKANFYLFYSYSQFEIILTSNDWSGSRTYLITIPDGIGGLSPVDWLYANIINPDHVSSSLINISPPPEQSIFVTLLLTWLPWLFIMVIGWIIILKVMKKQGGQMNFGKSTAIPQISNVKFSDVAGYDEVKQELEEMVSFLKEPHKYNAVGARTPKGVLMVGPPGTGKTLFAKAIAGESGTPFFSISGSDFVEMFVGVGASRVRSLFNNAKKTGRALIFIDELDAVGRQRGAGVGGGNDEREQTLNQLLVEMDGFSANVGIIVIAATNRPDVLDPALKRPGRFDREISLRLPDVLEREAILRKHSTTKQVSKEIDWLNIAMRTPGFTGADLENVVNEAAILTIRFKQTKITLNIIDEAIDRVIGGPSKTENSMSQEEKKLVAYHEAGHALIGLILKEAHEVQKISIVPRGPAGGYVLMTPKKEKIIQTKGELNAQITSYLGGRASEEIFFGVNEVTTGAYSDIEEATKIARKMVTEFGMSPLGPIQYEQRQGSVFLGRELAQDKSYSSKLAFEIDTEVRKIIDSAYSKALKIVSKEQGLIKLFATALMKKETLNKEEINYIYKHKKLPNEIIELEIKENKASQKIKDYRDKEKVKAKKMEKDEENKNKSNSSNSSKTTVK